MMAAAAQSPLSDEERVDQHRERLDAEANAAAAETKR